MNAKEYQIILFEKLKRIFGESNVEKEWDAAKNSQDDFSRKIYCPKTDIAIGPFNIDRQVEINRRRIEATLGRHETLIHRLIEASQSSTGSKEEFLTNRNKNPRCLIAIEIEGSGSRKHMLGDIANASILGLIGIIIPLTSEKLEAFKRILDYIRFATAAGKLNPSFNNILLINKEFEF
jgi:hypothetical protein